MHGATTTTNKPAPKKQGKKIQIVQESSDSESSDSESSEEEVVPNKKPVVSQPTKKPVVSQPAKTPEQKPVEETAKPAGKKEKPWLKRQETGSKTTESPTCKFGP